jgi:superoxide dismutase, Fe-Mn family
MAFTQPALPYSLDALKPFVTEEQVSFHYGKHHASYYTNLNKLLDGKPESELAIRDLVIKAGPGGVFNNAAQAWNHTFFWYSLSPNGGGKPSGELAAAIDRDFGSFDEFKTKFGTAATTLFGSGWAWLAKNPDGKLEIQALSNADTPLKHGKEPLLTLDVWEHAYYIDYRNLRPKFVEAFWDAANWDFASKVFAGETAHPGL